MKHFEFRWQTDDGLELFAQGWQPEFKIQGIVCLIHGLGEHSGRYAHVAGVLNQAGYVLVGFDLRGHGKSQGQRGHAPSYGALMDDITHFLDETVSRFPNHPYFLYGHSLGGNLVLNYALRHNFKPSGIIATSPHLGLAFKPPKWKIMLSEIINKLGPSFSLETGIDTNLLSRDPKVVQAYKNDPLNHNRISARLYVNINQAIQYALEHADQFPLPLLLMHGSADHLTSLESSRKFSSQIHSNCTFKVWEDFYHEIHNEPGQEEVFKFLTDWLKVHIPA